MRNEDYHRMLQDVWPSLSEMRSTLFVEASELVRQHDLVGLSGSQSQGGDESTIYELRRYQLELGYTTVPQFLEHYNRGLGSKLSAIGTDPTTSLCTVMYNEVGPLNEVIELWRHGGLAAMDRSRQAARTALPWRQAIGNIAKLAQKFTNTIHRPV